jgi:hypothetical protein
MPVTTRPALTIAGSTEHLFAFVKLTKQLLKVFSQLLNLGFGTAAPTLAATYAERYITHQHAEQQSQDKSTHTHLL